jgi:UDP-glucose 4-epimerase
MKILVTGGAGFIGSHIVDRLINEGHNVSIIDNLTTGNKNNLNQKARFYCSDITNEGEVMEAINESRPNIIVHAAAQISVSKSQEFPEYDAQVNIMGGINILNAAKQFGVNKIVFLSSSAIYGEPHELFIREDNPTNPTSPYGISKLTFEKYLALPGNPNYTILRLANVYGPRQNPEFGAVIPSLIKRALNNEPLQINGNGEQTRDFVYVQDVVDAVMAVLQHNIRERIFNIGTTKRKSIIELAELIRGLVISDSKIEHLPPKEEVKDICLDYKLASDYFQWEPKTNLTDGLKETIYSMRKTE